MGGKDPVDGLKELAPFVTTVVMKDCALTEREAIDEYGASLICSFPRPACTTSHREVLVAQGAAAWTC